MHRVGIGAGRGLIAELSLWMYVAAFVADLNGSRGRGLVIHRGFWKTSE